MAMPDKFDLEDYLKHLKTQPEETIYGKYAKEVASLQERLEVLENELRFTENCVLREVSHLDTHNQYTYTFPHKSKETARIFQKVIYDAIFPDFEREPHLLRRKEDKESQQEMEELRVLERPEKEPQQSINVVEEGYSCWQFCRYDDL